MNDSIQHAICPTPRWEGDPTFVVLSELIDSPAESVGGARQWGLWSQNGDDITVLSWGDEASMRMAFSAIVVSRTWA